MDMKKILQAFDGAATKKPVQGANDMKKFVSIVRESTNPYIPAQESVITSFEAGSVGGDANAFLLAADTIQDEVMAQVNKIKINADEASLRDMMDKFNAFMTAYHNVGKGILQPDMFNDSMGESTDLDEISDRTLKNYRQDAHTQVQGAKFGKGKGTPDAEKTIAKREKGMAAAGKRQQARSDAARANYKRPEPAKTSSGPQDWYGQNRYMGDSIEQGVTEGSESSIQKKIQAKQDSLSLAREQRRAKGQRQQGQREIKLQAEIDKLNTELTQLKRQGVAEGAPELLKKEMPLHRHAEKLLAQNGVSKDDPDYNHHLGNTIKHLRQFGNIDLINKQGVAEGSEDKIAKHNAAVTKLPGGQAHRSNHPDLLKKAPKGYSFSVSHKLVPDKQGVAEGSLNESDKFTSWYDWKDQAKSSGYTITKKDDKIVALNKQGQVVGHWSDVGKFLSGKAPRPNFKQPVEQGVAEGEKTMSRAAKGNEKYGKDGMRALAKAGRDGASEKKLDAIRDRHDKYNEGLSFKDYVNLAEAKKGLE